MAIIPLLIAKDNRWSGKFRTVTMQKKGSKDENILSSIKYRGAGPGTRPLAKSRCILLPAALRIGEYSHDAFSIP
jgi:hypothetical protein